MSDPDPDRPPARTDGAAPTPAGDEEAAGEGEPDGPAGEGVLPEWDDEYLDRVANDLKFNYDLSKDERVAGERVPLYGRLVMENRKQFLHESIDYANHAVHEHLFVRRVDAVTPAALERDVDRAHDLADDWIDADEEHRGTEFTFAVVAPAIPDDVRSFVSGFRDRTLLKFGYYGHYEVNLVVVAPDREDHVASRNADVWRAFAPWADPDDDGGGVLSRLGRLFGR